MTDSDKTIGDLELMRYFDGELEDDLVEAFVAGNDEARSKLAGLALSAAILREQVDDDPRGDGIADLVMGALDGDGTLEDDDALEGEAGLKDTPDAGGAVQLDGPAAKPANDNSRTIYVLAAAAAAVAAGMVLWGRMAPPSDVVADGRTGPTSMLTPTLTEAPAATDRANPQVGAQGELAGSAVEEDAALGVEVAAVDFGTQAGSVFYVPGGAEGETAVVWVTDLGDN